METVSNLLAEQAGSTIKKIYVRFCLSPVFNNLVIFFIPLLFSALFFLSEDAYSQSGSNATEKPKKLFTLTAYDPTLIFYFSNDISINRSYKNGGRQYSINQYDGFTAGIQGRVYFSKRISTRLGLNYVYNRTKYVPSYTMPPTVLIHHQPALVTHIRTNHFQIPWFLEYSFVKRKNLDVYFSGGFAMNFEFEGDVAEETIIAERDGQTLLQPSHYQFNWFGTHVAVGANYKMRKNFSLNIEPIIKYAETWSNNGYLYFGIGTNLIYKF